MMDAFRALSGRPPESFAPTPADTSVSDTMTTGQPATPVDQPTPSAPPATPVDQPTPSAPVENPFLADDKAYHAHAETGAVPAMPPVAPKDGANPFLEDDKAYHSHAEKGVVPGVASQGDHDITVSAADKAKSEALQNDISSILSTPGEEGDIRARLDARMRQNGYGIGDIKGLEESLKFRRQYPGTLMPVGLETPKGWVDPVSVHGPDQGKLAAFGVGALDGATVGAIPQIGGAIGATENSIKGLFGGGTGESWTDTYGHIRDVNRQAIDDAQHYHPLASLAGELAGGAATIPIGGEASLGKSIAEGALYNGAYGFNQDTGSWGSKALHGAEGAAIGATLGGVIGGPASAIGRMGDHAGTTADDVIGAAERLSMNAPAGQEIQPLIAHTSMGGMGSTLTNLGENSLLVGKGGGLQRAVHSFEDNTALARDRIATETAGGGPVRNLDDTAARLNDPANPGSLVNYPARGKIKSDALYDHAQSLTPDNFKVTPTTFVPWLAAKIAKLNNVAGDTNGVDRLKSILDDMSQGKGLDLDSIRSLRTRFGSDFNATDGEVRGIAKQASALLSDDVKSSMAAAGAKDASSAWSNADRNYSRYLDNKSIVSKVVGDGSLSADQVSDRIGRMARTDYDKLGRAFDTLPKGEADGARASIVDSLGRQKAGQQTSADGFSLNTFATQWDRANLSDHAKAALFTPQTVKDLDDLATLARAQKAFRKKGNSSRSGVTLENYEEAKAGAHAIGHVLSTGTLSIMHVVGAVTAVLGGHVLASPGVARAIVRGTESGSLEILGRRLGEAARRNPGAAAEILHLRSLMMNSHAAAVPGGGVAVAASAAPAAPEYGDENWKPTDDPAPVDQTDYEDDPAATNRN